MKSVLSSLCSICLVFAATVVSAECVEQAKLVGTWERFDIDITQVGEDIATGMKAVEAGDKKPQEMLDEYGSIEGTPAASQVIEFGESGEMTVVASISDTLDSENDIEGYFYATVKGNWSLDCAQVTLEASSLEKMEVPLDHLNDDQKKQVEQEAIETKDEMMEIGTADVQRFARAFGISKGGEVRYVSDAYILMYDEETDTYMLLKKK